MIAALALLAVAVLGFVVFPGADLAVSGLYFDGTGFPVQQSAVIDGLRQVLIWAEDIAALASLLVALWAGWRGRSVVGMAARDWAYGFAIFALGPGLLVNGVLKPVWGRARPDHVTQFGGTAQFSPFWQISGQCPRNCSFTSGEAAGAVALAILLGLILRANRARLGGLYGLGLGGAASVVLFTLWQRVAAGRHFLSDVVFGAAFVLIIALALRPLAARAPAA